MKKTTWKSKIKACCIEAGTYRPYFKYVIDALAGILERRDMLLSDFDMDPDETMVIETARNGRIINPLISESMEMDKQALKYWKELGLTPAGLKKLNDSTFGEKKNEKGGNSLLGLLEKQKETEK